MRFSIAAFLILAATLHGSLAEAGDPSRPNRVPLTRPDMKQYLEDLKARQPRIPLPELTRQEQEQMGPRGASYEGRLRFHYLPASERRPGGGEFSRQPDPNMTLDYAFKTMLFWIVSRTNNCHY